MANDRGPATFDQIIAPLNLEVFLSEYWGKSFVRVPGDRGRFERLLSWDELNTILEDRRITPPRLRLYRDGKAVETRRYLELENGPIRLKAASLVNCLSDGATLILDSVEEFAPAVRRVAESCQQTLRASTVVNLYAGWRTQQGFDLHWDNQDTLIVQISGRKHWRVYRPTRVHPLQVDLEGAAKPSEPPVWEGILEDGDVLYMPRGWWHVAVPLDEPSLHLTFTITPPSGDDLMQWMATRLRRHAEVRMNVPHPDSGGQRLEYLSLMRALVIKEWDDDTLDQFLAEWEAGFRIRPQIRLPLAVAEATKPVTRQTQVRLVANPQLSFVSGPAGAMSFYANGVRWNCDADIVPALACLRQSTSHSVAQLCAELPGAGSEPALLMFLTVLGIGGAVWLEDGRPG